MFFDKNEDNEVKIVDEVLSNDSFDKLSVELSCFLIIAIKSLPVAYFR